MSKGAYVPLAKGVRAPPAPLFVTIDESKGQGHPYFKGNAEAVDKYLATDEKETPQVKADDLIPYRVAGEWEPYLIREPRGRGAETFALLAPYPIRLGKKREKVAPHLAVIDTGLTLYTGRRHLMFVYQSPKLHHTFYVKEQKLWGDNETIMLIIEYRGVQKETIIKRGEEVARISFIELAPVRLGETSPKVPFNAETCAYPPIIPKSARVNEERRRRYATESETEWESESLPDVTTPEPEEPQPSYAHALVNGQLCAKHEMPPTRLKNGKFERTPSPLYTRRKTAEEKKEFQEVRRKKREEHYRRKEEKERQDRRIAGNVPLAMAYVNPNTGAQRILWVDPAARERAAKPQQKDKTLQTAPLVVTKAALKEMGAIPKLPKKNASAEKPDWSAEVEKEEIEAKKRKRETAPAPYQLSAKAGMLQERLQLHSGTITQEEFEERMKHWEKKKAEEEAKQPQKDAEAAQAKAIVANFNKEQAEAKERVKTKREEIAKKKKDEKEKETNTPEPTSSEAVKPMPEKSALLEQFKTLSKEERAQIIASLEAESNEDKKKLQ